MKKRFLPFLGILLIAIPLLAQSCYELLGRSHINHLDKIIAYGQYALVTSNDVLLVIDTLDPNNPTVMGEIYLPEDIVDIALYQDTAVLSCTGSLELVDLTDPAHPLLVGTLTLNHYDIYDVTVSSSYAYVACDNAVEIVDITVPSAPTIVNTLSDLGWGLQYITSSNDKLVFGNSSYSHIYIYTLQSHVNPVQVSVIDNLDIYLLKGLKIYNNYLYMLVNSDTFYGAYIYDISMPTNPSYVSEIPSSMADFRSLYFNNDYLYIVNVNYYKESGDILVYDISDPSTPTQNPHGPPCNGVITTDDYYFTICNSYFKVYPIESWPSEITSIAYPATPHAITTDGRYIYTIPGPVVFDAGDPSSISVNIPGPYCNNCDNDYDYFDVDVEDDTLYAERLYTFTPPDTLTEGDNYPDGEQYLYGGNLYVSDTDGINIYARQTDGHLYLINHFSTPTGPQHFTISRGYCYVTCDDDPTLYIYNVLDTSNVFMVNTLTASGDLNTLATNDELLALPVYASDQTAIYDITDPAYPLYQTEVGNAGKVQFDNDRLYINRYNGFYVYDILDPDTLVLYDTLPAMEDFYVKDYYIYEGGAHIGVWGDTCLGCSAPWGLSTPTATDDICADDGVTVTWAMNPSTWGDYGGGTRSYDLLRDGVVIASGIPYGTTTYVDTGGSNNILYTYTVRYRNRCGSFTDSPPVQRADSTGLSPEPFAIIGPEDGIMTTSTTMHLSWEESASHPTYDIYFGIVTPPPLFQSGWTSNTMDMTDLSLHTTYYWKIVAVNACGETEGPTRHFTINTPYTACPQSMAMLYTQESHAALIEGSHLYTTDGALLAIYDITTPTTPALLGSLDLSQTIEAMDLSGTTLCLSLGTGGVALVDVGDPLNPTLLTTLSTNDRSGGVVISGTTLYVAEGSDGVRIYDITTPSAPVEIGWADTPGSADDVTLSGSALYVADGTSGVGAIEVTNPANPQIEGWWNAGIPIHTVAARGVVVYAGGEDNTLHVIDFANPFNPMETTAITETAQVKDLTVDADYLGAAVDTAGIFVYDIQTPRQPKLTLSHLTRHPSLSLAFGPSSLLTQVSEEMITLYSLDCNECRTPTFEKEITVVDLSSCNATGLHITWENAVSDWGDTDTGARHWELYRDGTLIATLPFNQENYDDTTVTPFTTYTYFIVAVNACGIQSQSDPRDGVDRYNAIPGEFHLLSPPDGAQETGINVRLLWEPLQGINLDDSQYYPAVYISDNPDDIPGHVASKHTNKSYIIVEGLNYDTTYYWQVRYRDCESRWSPLFSFSTGPPPPTPCLTEVYSDRYGAPKLIEKGGNYLFRSIGRTVQILDATLYPSPILGEVTLDEFPNIILFNNDKLYVFTPYHHILIDVLDPSSPNVIQDEPLTDMSKESSLVLNGNVLYSLSRTVSEIRVYDIANPNSIQYVSTISTTNPSDEGIIKDNYLYIGYGNSLMLYDITDPFSPSLSYTIDINSELIDIHDNYLYSFSYYYRIFYIYDITDPPSPTVVSQYDIDIDYAYISYPMLYTMTGFSNKVFSIYDISDPTNVLFMGDLSTHMQDIFAMLYLNDHVFIADTYIDYSNDHDNDSARINDIDVSNPTNPIMAADTPYPSGVYGFSLYDHHLYTETGWDQLRIVDVTDPASPVEVAYGLDWSWGNQQFVLGNTVFINQSYAPLFNVYSLNNPDDPQLIGSTEGGTIFYSYFYSNRIYYDSPFLFMSNEWPSSSVKIYDISNEANPELKVTYEESEMNDFVFYNHFLYTNNNIVNVEDPRTPMRVNNDPEYYSANEYITKESYLIAKYTNYNSMQTTFAIFEIKDPETFIFKNAITFPEYIEHIKPFGNTLVGWSSWSFHAIYMMDISDPLHIKLLDSLYLSDLYQIYDIIKDGDTLYAACDDYGLKIIHSTCSSCQAPTSGNVSAVDDDPCSYGAIRITWDVNPLAWNDQQYENRYTTLLKNGAILVDHIPYGTHSYLDTDVQPGQPVTYRVIYTNGCGETAATPTVTATDEQNQTVQTFALSTPDDGAVNVTAPATLSWEEAPNAVAYDLYLGLENPPPLFASSISDNTFTPDHLYPETLYYWRVIARNACSNFTTPIRSFTTGIDTWGCPETRVIFSPTTANDAAIYNDIIYIANDDKISLLTLQTDTLHIVNNLPLGETIHALSIAGTDLYAGTESGILHYTLSDPLHPLFVDRYNSSSPVSALSAQGDRLAAFIEPDTLALFQVTAPAGLSLLGSTPQIYWGNHLLKLHGQTIYITTDAGLEVYDFSNPSTPRLLYTYLSPSSFALSDSADILYYKRGDLFIYDISDPANPAIVSTTNVPDQYTLTWDNDYLYGKGGSTIYIYDVHDPANPTAAGQAALPAESSSSESSFLLPGSTHFYAATKNWVSVYAMADPFTLTYLSFYQLFPTMSHGDDPPIKTEKLGSYLITCESYSVKCYDTSHPDSVVELWNYYENHEITDARRNGDTLYVATVDGFFILSLVDPTSPLLLSSNETLTDVGILRYDDDLLYLMNYPSNHLVVLDVSQATNPSIIFDGSATTQLRDSVIYHGIAYAPDKINNALKIYDVSDPANITLINTLTFGQSPRKVVRDGDYLYVDFPAYDVSVFILGSDPTTPTLLTTLSLESHNTIDVKNGYLNAAHYDDWDYDSFNIYDVSDPLHPSLLYPVGEWYHYYGMTLLSDVQLVAHDEHYRIYSTGCLECRNPIRPAAPAIVEDPCQANDLHLSWLKDSPDWLDGNQGVRSYEIYRNDALLTTLPYGTTTYSDTTVPINTTVKYNIGYVNGCGKTILTGGAWGTDSNLGPPQAASNPVPAQGSEGCINTLSWDPSPDADTYDIFVNGTLLCSGTTATSCPINVGNGLIQWYVVAHNACSSTTGPLWEFTQNCYATLEFDHADFSQEIYGDLDGVMEPGETCRIQVGLKNNGNIRATSAWATFSVDEGSVCNARQFLGEILPGETVTVEIDVRVGESATCPGALHLSITGKESLEGTYPDDIDAAAFTIGGSNPGSQESHTGEDLMVRDGSDSTSIGPFTINAPVDTGTISYTLSGKTDLRQCVQISLEGPDNTTTILKDYGAVDQNPYDVTSTYTQPGAYTLTLTESPGCGGSFTAAQLSTPTITLQINEMTNCDIWNGTTCTITPVEDPLITLEHTGTEVTITWNDVEGETAYHLYTLDSLSLPDYIYTQIQCALAQDSTSTTFQDTNSTSFYILTTANGNVEGSYGMTGDMHPRPPSTSPCP